MACIEHAWCGMVCEGASALLGDGDTVQSHEIHVAGIRVDSHDGSPLVCVARWFATFRLKVPVAVLRKY